MVERPIKRSERQNTAEGSDVVNTNGTEQRPTESRLESDSQFPAERNRERPFRGKDKSKGKGKGNQQESENAKPPMNLALMRGPKPSKAKPPVLQKTEEETAADSVNESGQEAIAEGEG